MCGSAASRCPTSEELDHDYLWRYARRLPARGEIGIFNRSHYEEVLVVRVHPEVLARQKLPDSARAGHLWHRRYREINDWERYLSDNGFKIVKLFLNLSKEEQRQRFLKRIDRPEKNWKFSSADARERRRWDDYQEAFSHMLSATSTEWAPWYVIPADRKWFARICAAAVIAHTLIEIDPQYPTVSDEARAELLVARDELMAQAPRPRRPPRRGTGRRQGGSIEGGHDMAVTVDETGRGEAAEAWYAQSPDAVAAALHVDPADGLSGAEVAKRLAATGPNALPEEEPEPGWRRFLAQYRSYMQLILIAAAVVSALIAEWGTAVLLVALTVLNAVVGLRQQGKAESAMNALKSMVKATARVRRDGTETRARRRPAGPRGRRDPRRRRAGAGRRAHRRRQRPADRRVGADRRERAGGQARLDAAGGALNPGDQTNMAFMNTPVTHGSGVLVVTGTGADTELGKISGLLSATAREESPLTREMDRLTLWIAGRRRTDDDRDVRPRPQPRRGVGHAVHRRGLAGDRRDPGGAADGDPDDPVAGRDRPGQAQRDRQGSPVGRDPRLHLGDQLGQDRDADAEPDDRRGGGHADRPVHDLRHGLRARRQGAPRRPAARPRSRPRSCRTSSPATPSWWTARWSATRPRARCSCSATRPGWTSTPPATGCPGWPPCRSTRPTS